MSSRLIHLLRRSTRRYTTSSSASFPYQAPISAAGASNPHDHDPINSGYTNNNNLDSPTADTPQYNPYPNPQSHPPPFESNPNHQFQPSAGDSPNFQYSSKFSNHFQPTISSPNNPTVNPASYSVPVRSYGFSSAEEAAAERRRRKRRLRIEPPLYALRPNPTYAPPNANDPDKPKLPDSTSALVGNRLNLHNRVQSLIRAGDLVSASYVVRQSVFQSVRPTVFTCNAIIAAMYRAKRYNDAKALFQYFFRQFNIIPNIVSYNNLIVSHCESNEVDDALKVYEYIIENAPYSPSAVSYRHLTKGLIDADRINDAVSLLREMLNKGHGADSLVYNNVILGFLNLGNLEKANELFDELKERCTVYDGVVNAAFMDWFFKQEKPKEAMESYRDLMGRNYRMVPATRNVLLETLLRHGKHKEAWDLFNDMLDDHTPPTFQAVNSDTFNMMVNECFKEGKVEEAMEVFKRSGKGVKSKPFQMDVAGFNNMILRMCELEMMDEAEQYYKQLCDKSLSPDVNTYRILIDTYIKVDRVENMLEKYAKMVDLGLRVIPQYANKWFGFLIEKGKSFDCIPVLSKMADREPKPDVTTYDIVIRGLVEVGNYDAITNVLREMTNHGVGTSASLKDFVLDVFEKQGRRVEIENILNSYSSHFPPQRPFQGTRAPARMAWSPQTAEQGARNPALPWQTASPPSAPQTMAYDNNYTERRVYQPQITEQMVHPQPMSGHEAEPVRMAGQYGT
ncbi:pentatricopeptide repeat-containing protein At1g10270-like [Henckelia pumila]|uniref:pentatricopeptide repeat-containing protein At1g10270-like n=1 Tax=Henckelia pumila TaxID=405737 RepID=UPI003C6DE665